MPIDQHTFDALKGLWILVGGERGHSDVAAAIAFAESGGCQYALAGPIDIRPVKQCTWNPTNGENSCGYWQINLRAHPQYHAPAIFDEYTNARAAVAISGGGRSFAAWSTYTNGAYLPYLEQFGGGSPGPPPPPPTGGHGITPSNLSSVNGWNHFTGAAARDLPRGLATSQRYRRATLQLVARSRKVR